MTRMTFKSKVTKKLKPSTVRVHLTFNTEGKNQQDVISELSDKFNKAKDFITTFRSYKTNSYTQTKMSTIKDTVRKKNYKTEVKGYRCNASCYAILEYGETAVEDLLTIINMSIEKNITLNYEFIVDPTLVMDTYDELMAEVINLGYEKICKLVQNTVPFNGKSVEITDILSSTTNLESPKEQEFERAPSFYNRAPTMVEDCTVSKSATKTRGFFGADKALATPEEEEVYVPERVITADMIEAMFNAESKAVCEVSLQYEVK